MYRAIPTQPSCASAWIAACTEVMHVGDEGYNVVIDIADPVTHSDKDNKVITLVDKFLKVHDEYPIITVSNTIFPQSLFAAHGSPEFYKIYHRDFALFSSTKGWGRYFQRMTAHIDRAGKRSSPLQDVIDKIKKYKSKGKRVKAAYELAIDPTDSQQEETQDVQAEDVDITIYQPSSDRNRQPGGPCLSYLSFKCHPEQGLLLTVMYRNHYYITRLLGNLIGLGRLQAFVASETGIPRGSLTVISTHAELDTGKWGIVKARELVNRATDTLRK